MFYEFTIIYSTYTPGICEFSNGYVDSTKSEDLGDTGSEIECARLVGESRPFAIGATWFKSGPYNNTCIAEYGTGATVVYDPLQPYHSGCIFQGNYIALNTFTSFTYF